MDDVGGLEIELISFNDQAASLHSAGLSLSLCVSVWDARHKPT